MTNVTVVLKGKPSHMWLTFPFAGAPFLNWLSLSNLLLTQSYTVVRMTRNYRKCSLCWLLHELYSNNFTAIVFITLADNMLFQITHHPHTTSCFDLNVFLVSMSSWIHNSFFFYWCTAGKLWRRRTVIQAPQGDGRPCPSQLEQWKPCLVKPCYSWRYSAWSECKSEVRGPLSYCQSKHFPLYPLSRFPAWLGLHGHQNSELLNLA